MISHSILPPIVEMWALEVARYMGNVTSWRRCGIWRWFHVSEQLDQGNFLFQEQ